MITFLTILHVTVCIFLAIVVLLQHGKGADMGATFGGGSQTVLGARGAATFLGKLTAVSAGIFMFTSISLAWFSAHQSSKSVFADQKPAAASTPSPAPTAAVSPSPSAK